MKMNIVFKVTALRIVLAILFATVGLAAGQAQEQAGSSATPADAPAQPQQPKRVRVSQGLSTGLLIRKVNPKYPDKAREQRVQGTVVLQAIISREGTITELTPISGDPLLIPSAVKAVKKWRYQPYFLNGQPVEVETTIQVNFTLSGG